MSKTVAIKTSELSKLTKQHFGEDTSSHPEEIQFAKQLIFDGEWEWLQELLEPFNGRQQHCEIVADIYKQEYIELVSQPNETSADRLVKLMKKVKKHDTVLYNSMLLLTAPTNPQQDRHTVFYKIAGYMYKYMYPSLCWKAPPTSTPSRLVELVTRGLLYEKMCKSTYNTPRNDQEPSTCICKTLFSNQPTMSKDPPTLSIRLLSPTPKQTLHHSLMTPPTSSAATILPSNKNVSVLLSKSVVNKVHDNIVATPFNNNKPNKQPHTSTPKDPSSCKRVIVNEQIFTPILKTTKRKVKELSTLLTTITDKQAIRSIAFTSDGHHLAVGSNSKTLKIFDTNTTLYKGVSLPELYTHDDYHTGSIYCLGWNTKSDLLASGSNDRTINLLYKGTDHYERCGNLKNPGGILRELLFINNNYLVGVGGNGLSIMSAYRLTIVFRSTCNQHIYCVCPIEENIMATGDELGCVNLWDTRQRYPVYTHRPLAEYTTVTSIDYNNNNITFSTNTGRCYTILYNGMGSDPINTWLPHGNEECRTIRYSPDGKWLLTGSYNGQVSLTNTATSEYIKICQHNDKVIQARWCYSDQNIIATSSADKTVCLWKLNL